MVELGRYFRAFIPTGISLVIAFVIGSFFIISAHVNPLEAYYAMFIKSFSSLYLTSEILTRMTPLLLSGIGVALAFKSGFWNIGGEGQIILGLMGANFVGFYFTGLHPIIHLLLVLLTGAVAGGFWAFIPGVLKVKLGVNEILTTLLMNYIAIWFGNYVTVVAWKDPGVTIPQTYRMLPSARLPHIIPGSRCSLGLVFAIVTAVLIYIILFRSTFGYRLRVAGLNPKAARVAGINVPSVVLTSAIISGMLSGLAGAVEVSGVHYFIRLGITGNFGYISVAVAMLANLHPLWTIFSSFFFGILLSGGEVMHRAVGLPFVTVDIIIGIIMVTILLREYIAHVK
ncbi:MAG: ABC transporter permease, partial [Candidatus Baldrarchaeia archaeon]